MSESSKYACPPEPPGYKPKLGYPVCTPTEQDFRDGWEGESLSIWRHRSRREAGDVRPAFREADPCCEHVVVTSRVESSGEQSEPLPRFRSGRHSGQRGGGLRLHALFSDSIHLSKLIFDIHSDLEGRHGDNSQKVENNIIATNMNYWPPG